MPSGDLERSIRSYERRVGRTIAPQEKNNTYVTDPLVHHPDSTKYVAPSDEGASTESKHVDIAAPHLGPHHRDVKCFWSRGVDSEDVREWKWQCRHEHGELLIASQFYAC
eukprot:9821122-Alexandrium_andersonii.AAC.1